MKKHSIIEGTVLSLTILVGLTIYHFLSETEFPVVFNVVVSFLSSSAFYELLYQLLLFLCSNIDTLLKLLWGKQYLKGYWSYTYERDGEKKYGAWCIDQKYDSISIKGFGISTNDYSRRSDVQSVSELIPRGDDFEILNMRRDVDEKTGAFPDEFYYSKTSLHLKSRKTFLNLLNYPLEMTGVTIIYGGNSSGIHHAKLYFKKHPTIKSESEIEEYVKSLIEEEKKVPS